MSTVIDSVGEIISEVKSEFVNKWMIKNFFEGCKENGQKLQSPMFSTGGYKWTICVYPKGANEESEEFVSIYLKSFNESDVEVTYSFHLLDAKNVRYPRYFVEKCVFQEYEKAGTGDFVPQSAVLDSKNNVLPKGMLTIQCDIQIAANCHCERVNNDLQPITPDYSCKIENMWRFETFFNNQEFSDVKFIIDGTDFHAHKNILANQSDVFAAMFKHGMKESLENTVEIDDVNYEVMQELFRFVYTGKINNIDKLARDLFLAADKYALEELKSTCVKYLCDSLSLDNALGCLDFADHYGISKLKQQAVDFIVSRAKYIEKFAGFVSIRDLHKDVMVEVFRRFTGFTLQQEKQDPPKSDEAPKSRDLFSEKKIRNFLKRRP